MGNKERRRQEKREALKRFSAGSAQLRREKDVRLAVAGISSADEARRMYFDGTLTVEEYAYLLHGNRKYSQREVAAFCRRLGQLKKEQLTRITAAGYESVDQVTVLYLRGEISLDKYVHLLHGDD